MEVNLSKVMDIMTLKSLAKNIRNFSVNVKVLDIDLWFMPRSEFDAE